jgi:hypothetical protein
MAQIVKLRRSSVSGQKPTNTTLQLGELALNTVDGKVFFAKSGSLGPTVEELVSTNTTNTGSINISGSINLEGNQTITGSLYGTNIISGSQIWGDGGNLINIPLSGVTNLVTISGSFDNRINEITSSLDSINNFSSSVVLTSQTSSMTVMSASYALTASYALNAEGSGGAALGSYSSLVITEAASTWSFKHGTGQRYPIFQVFDNNGFVIIPSQIQTIDENNANIIFPSPQTGRVIASLGGGNGNTEEFLNSDLWVVDHNLGTDYPDVIIWDSNRNVIFPNRIESVNENQIKVYFSVPVSGHVSVSRGGHIISGSVDSDWVNITNKPTGLVSGSGQITYSGINGVPSGIVSGSDQLTGSYDTRYVLSGSITQTTWDNIANKPVGIVSGSSQVEITGTTGYSTFSSSIDTSISSSVSSLSSSIATTDLNQDNRLGSLETESGSIRGNFNTFTSSYTTGSFTGSFIGDGSGLYNIPASGVTGLQLNKITSGSVSASISPDRGLEINTDVYIDGTLTAKELYINYISSSVLYESGSTKFGDTLDDTHEFTGSVNITGSISLNGQPIGTGKLDEVTFNTFTSSYTTGSFTGSFIGDGSQLTNIPASGVTGLNLNKIVSGSVSASISPDRGLEINTDTTISGSLQISGSGFLNSHRILTDLDTGSMGLINSIQFNTSSNISVKPGELAWNNTDGTLDLGMKGGNVVQQIGQEIFYEVRNETGIQIPNGTAVYANGVTAGSGRITIAPYTADGSIRENRFLGIATENITSGINGFVTHFGYVRGLDTRGTTVSSIAVGDETWAVGDILYVHPTVAGKLTNVKPQHEVTVAIVINRHQSAGILFVRPSSGGHLEDVHDILINTGSLTNGQVLAYNSTNGLWENTNTISGSLNVTGGLTGSIDYSNLTNKPTLVSGSSQISYSGLTGIPSDIVSSSSQISAFGFLETSSFNTYTSSVATTGSNAFVGNQNINGNLSVTGSVVISGSLDISNANVGSSRFLFTQTTGSTTWNITHNLNYNYPNVTVYDGSTNKVMLPADVTSIDVNTTQVTFATPEYGYALVSVGGITTATADRFLFTATSATGSWVIDHNMGYKYVNIDVYDNNDEQLIPQKVTAVSVNRTQVDFSLPTSGNAIITLGGPRSTSIFNQTGSFYNTQFNIGITGSLVVTGDVDADNFNTTSDKKLKTDLIRIEGALDKIEKLNGYTFNWLEEYNEDRTRQIGLIADEVYEVQPELISNRSILLGGKEEEIKLLDYSKVTALLLEGIKELTKRITKLENKRKKK